MDIEQTSLWRAGFGDPSNRNPDAEELAIALKAMRKLVSTLVNQIHIDLPQYTVHDITHLDALWGIASEIAGPSYPITPTEAFVFGAAILLHDAGMTVAAYQGGISEIKKHPKWIRLLNKYALEPSDPTIAEIDTATEEFLRLEHAERAKQLPFLTWVNADGVGRPLIESADARQKFGQIAGEIAASHWWDQELLIKNLDRIVPAPPPYQVGWSMDLLKLASLLRVADAAHIDERRAPGFLFALRNAQLFGISREHWQFQNKLTQPEIRSDALYYSSTSDFSKPEAEAWWLAYDTLKAVDRELRDVDAMLADSRSDLLRFAGRRVANVDTPLSLTSAIRVSGWIPIDTRVQIHNVIALVSRLGGSALYGSNPMVPVRELVQNAADAIRLKAAVEGGPSPPKLKLILTLDAAEPFLEIVDNGIGMNAEMIKRYLLDCGASGWTSDSALLEASINIVRSLSLSGKFGIGFFSVFMIGQKVELFTRRYDRGFDETLLLRFESGVARRPILSVAEKADWMTMGGTSVRVSLSSDAVVEFKKLIERADKGFFGLCAIAFPTLDIPMHVVASGSEQLVDGSEWRVEPSEVLLQRLSGLKPLSELEQNLARNVRPIFSSNGEVQGRLCLCHPEWSWREDGLRGTVVVNGASSVSMQRLAGVVNGAVQRASRDEALPDMASLRWSDWLEEQCAIVVADSLFDFEAQMECAATVLALGGDPGPLKICETGAIGPCNASELAAFVATRSTVKIVQDASVSLLKRYHPSMVLDADVIAVDMGIPSIFNIQHGWGRAEPIVMRGLEDLVFEIVEKAWGLKKNTLSKLRDGTSAVDDGNFREIEIATVEDIRKKEHAYVIDRNNFVTI